MITRTGLRFAAATLAALAVVGTLGTSALAAPPPTDLQPAALPPAALPPAALPLTSLPALTGDWVRDEQWYLKTLNVGPAWALASGEGVTVAVIDSGVDAAHADLSGQVLPGIDLVDRGGDGHRDPVGHGTTVSAIIAGRGDDSAGIVGMAPKAKILPVRVLDQDNRYDDALIVAKAVRWAVDHGARVINLSLGGSGDSATLAAALDYAFAKDVVVVACTGNTGLSGTADVWYPAREPGVLAVAGLERDGQHLWSGSITGRQTVLTAPATQLLGARPGGYWRVQGTSFAAPMVSGTAALIRSRWPTMSAADVINRIIHTAKDEGPAGHDSVYGYGEVDPTAALTADLPAVLQNPLDTAPPPGVSGFGDAPIAGQSRTGPDSGGGRPAHARAAGTTAGWAVAPEETGTAMPAGGWWAAGAFFLLSALGALLTVRRYRDLT